MQNPAGIDYGTPGPVPPLLHISVGCTTEQARGLH